MLILKQQQTAEFLANPYLLVLIITLSITWILKKCFFKNPSNTNPPPSPPKLPILGNLHQLSPLTHRSFQSLSAKHGPVTLLHFGSRPVVIVQSTDAASEIMKTNDLIFANKPGSGTTRQLLYDGKNVTVAPYGEYWRKMKSICVLQLLSGKRVRSFKSIREEETALLMNRIKSCCSSFSPVDLSGLFVSLANDVVCRSAFGRKYSEGEDGRRFVMTIKEIMHLLGSASIGEFIPWLSWINRVNGFDYRVGKAAAEMDEFLEAVIEEHLKAGLERAKDTDKDNFVDILLNIYKDDATLDRDGMKGIILDMLVGGTDTAFAMLEWTMTELLRHLSIMKKLQSEVREIMKERQDITDEDMEKMLYLKAVIKESLRYHIPVPFLAREPSEDIKIKGYDVSKGTIVIVNSWAIARDPASWNEPEKFLPERFLSCSMDLKGLDFELLPFGAGRRRCPGIAFAMVHIELVLANLVQKFDWELPDGRKGEELDCEEDPGVTIHRKSPLLAVPTQCYF